MLAGVMAASLALAGQAQAAFGDLGYRGCDTAETSVTACSATADATTNGVNSGMGAAVDIAASPDGKHVYATSQGDNSVAWFTRSTTTGALTYGDCISGESGLSSVCAQVDTPSASGENSGLEAPDDIALSPDGEFLYVASNGDDAIAVFDRDTTSGALDFVECITGEQATGSAGTGACGDSSAPQVGGANSGMDIVAGLAVTSNSLYAIANQDDSVIRLVRNPTTGALTSFSCGSTETESGPVASGGTGACAAVGTPASGGTATGLNLPWALEVSPDGKSLYTVSFLDDAVTRFSRNLAGALVYRDCITGDQGVGSAGSNACDDSDTVTLAGADSGLHALVDVAVSPDNESVYAISGGDSATSHFDRNTTNGALDYQSCITGETESGPPCAEIAGATSLAADSGLDDLAAAAMPADGKSLYATATGDDAIAHFERDVATGGLTYRNCLTGQTQSGPSGSGACAEISTASSDGVNSGLDFPGELAATGDDRSVYAVAGFDSSVAHFNREDPPETTLDTAPPPTTADNTPTFTFSTDEPPSTFAGFECSIDGGAFGPCSGPGDSHTTSPLPDGPHTFSVRATDTWGFADATPASSAFTVDAVPDPSPPSPGPGAGPPPATDTDPPETTVTKQPKKKVETEKKKKNAKFEFTSDEAGSSFECEVDDKGFEPCSTPFKKKVKSDAKHTFEVRATDPAGNVDPTPVFVKWKVKRT